MWKFIDSQSILLQQHQLLFNYAPDTRRWVMDRVSRNIVAQTMPATATANMLQKAISSLELECAIWAYGRHPEREFRQKGARLTPYAHGGERVSRVRHAQATGAGATVADPNMAHAATL